MGSVEGAVAEHDGQDVGPAPGLIFPVENWAVSSDGFQSADEIFGEEYLGQVGEDAWVVTSLTMGRCALSEEAEP